MTINERITQCAALSDGVLFLSSMVNAGYAKVIASEQLHAQSKSLHYQINRNGVNALIGLAFDQTKSPIITTSNKPNIRWFSMINWGQLNVFADRIIFQCQPIHVGTGDVIQGISIELPVAEKIANLLAKQSIINIGYDDSQSVNVNIVNQCPVYKISAIN